ncbi:hypothetical protein PR002_g25874 [Phytophthora rubi]|uniref:Uncharacterized protein n=1 Tax=Phytophthora rubi TaxID=129364 RepID=A0A6A3HUZ3_9STRA|nr:hypothetical protein PR002_g25874 [Phytophthora rubi]
MTCRTLAFCWYALAPVQQFRPGKHVSLASLASPQQAAYSAHAPGYSDAYDAYHKANVFTTALERSLQSATANVVALPSVLHIHT